MPRSELIAYAIAAALVLVLTGRWLGGRASQPAGAGTSAAALGSSAGGGRDTGVIVDRAGPSRVVVHVAGAVRHPGVYTLREGARVRDAVSRAGGPSRTADEDAVNLAAKLADGQQVVVPRRVPVGGTAVSAA